MSGAGKSTVLAGLAARGRTTVDTDYDGWTLADGRWDAGRMAALLATHGEICVSGTVENQGEFYDRFEHVVLLTAPLDVLLDRLQSRTTNPYGRSPEQQAEVRTYVTEVEPLLRRGATLELDGRLPVEDLVDLVEGLLKPGGPELQLLRADHAPAVLAFEIENRDYFATSISDRGDEYFEQFAEVHRTRLAEQEAGSGAYYVLVADDGAVIGRFNLIFVEDGVAELGYRVAEHAAGRGIATTYVRDLCRLAVSRHGITTLRAATSHGNVATQRVLLSNGFDPAGPADPADIGGKTGTWYQRDLAVS
jgi:ribosomal-protein-alanine N-acetyltransferase